MDEHAWQLISTAPYDKDLELAVVENAHIHALVFRCRRSAAGWINAATGRRIDVHPTHWREWRDEN